MKKIIYILTLALMAMFTFSCQDDPWDDISDGAWNKEHRVISIKFEGQAGLPTIENIDQTTGTIDLQLATDWVADFSQVEVLNLELSYDGISSISEGDKIDFSGENPSFSVSSPNGQTRTYTINMTKFSESLCGYYSITGSKVWGGTGPEYGGGALMSPEIKSWCWNTNGYGPTAEYDDYIEISLTGLTDDGNTEGKCIHYGGEDAKHWNCIFAASQNKEGTDPIDLKKYYRQIPIGESTWLRDYTNNTITFTSSDGVKTTCTLLESGDYEVYSGENLSVTDYAFNFTLNGVDDWTNIYSDYDKFAKKARNFFVLIKKCDEIPEASKTTGIDIDPAE